MGFALAEVFASRGASVTLVAGPVTLPTPPGNIHRIDVESARDMREIALRECEDADVAIFSAAVADYRPASESESKIKRENREEMLLDLVKNPDIAADCGARKRERQYFIGFALETDHELANAEGKLERKNLDMIVLNSLRDKGAGFRTDTNKVTLLCHHSRKEFPLKSKLEVAADIADAVAEAIG